MFATDAVTLVGTFRAIENGGLKFRLRAQRNLESTEHSMICQYWKALSLRF